MTDERKTIALSIVDKFKMDTKNSDYTVIEGDDADQLVLDIATALAARERAVWLEAAKRAKDIAYGADFAIEGCDGDELIQFTTIIKEFQTFSNWCRQQAEAVKP